MHASIDCILKIISYYSFAATGKYLLPKGSSILIVPYKIHRLDEFYPNPEVFNPDNFLPERMQTRHYYSFIPFSAGPRYVQNKNKSIPVMLKKKLRRINTSMVFIIIPQMLQYHILIQNDHKMKDKIYLKISF